MTPDRAARIATLPSQKIKLQISLEGAGPRTHDAIRGDGSFDQAMTGLKHLVRAGLGHRVTLAYTETRATIDELPMMLEQVAALGLKRLVSGTLVAKGRARSHDGLQLPRPDQYRGLLQRYLRDPLFRARYDEFGNFAAIEWFKGKKHSDDGGFPDDAHTLCDRGWISLSLPHAAA